MMRVRMQVCVFTSNKDTPVCLLHRSKHEKSSSRLSGVYHAVGVTVCHNSDRLFDLRMLAYWTHCSGLKQ